MANESALRAVEVGQGGQKCLDVARVSQTAVPDLNADESLEGAWKIHVNSTVCRTCRDEQRQTSFLGLGCGDVVLSLVISRQFPVQIDGPTYHRRCDRPICGRGMDGNTVV